MNDARVAVLNRLTLAFEQSAIEEQVARSRRDGQATAEVLHKHGIWILRALDAEERDPKPKPPCGCVRCAALYASWKT